MCVCFRGRCPGDCIASAAAVSSRATSCSRLNCCCMLFNCSRRLGLANCQMYYAVAPRWTCSHRARSRVQCFAVSGEVSRSQRYRRGVLVSGAKIGGVAGSGRVASAAAGRKTGRVMSLDTFHHHHMLLEFQLVHYVLFPIMHRESVCKYVSL